MLPLRLPIRITEPWLSRFTIWPMMISRFTPGLSPNAAHMAIIRPTYPWWSAPSRIRQRSKPRSRLFR